jgi:hypothetical protein
VFRASLALQVAEFFRNRKARADFKAFDKIMRVREGETTPQKMVRSHGEVHSGCALTFSRENKNRVAEF